MSAKFPRGGGSKPILSHPSNCSYLFLSIAMHSSFQFQIRCLKYVLKKVITQKQITHQRTKSVECENFLGQTSLFVKFVIQALMGNRPRPLTQLFLTDFISNSCFSLIVIQVESL